MQKKNPKRLAFHRETLRRITRQEAAAAGGVTQACPATLACVQTGGSCVTCVLTCLTRATCTW
jgi:hypothetical protein